MKSERFISLYLQRLHC